MHIQELRSACFKVSCVTALLTFSLLFQPFVAEAAEIQPALASSPFRNTQYHVHYDVNADGTYTEQYDLVISVLNEKGVQIAGQMSIDVPNGLIFNKNDKELVILSAYTLKKNAERINAIQLKPEQAGTNRPMPAFLALNMQQKMIAFQNVEVGDSLVQSYKIVIKKTPLTDNVVIDQSFAKFIAYDDVEISLSAPISLNLRFETVGIEKEKSVVTGNIRKTVWKYRNRTPEVLLPNQKTSPDSFSKIHISSFKDKVAENAAMAEAMSSMPPPPYPENQRCQVQPGAPNDGPDALNMYASKVVQYFWHADGYLKREVNDWNTPACMFDDGKPRIAALGYGFYQAINREKDWSKSLARVEYLKKKYPMEGYVAMAEASYWKNYAWNARGEGYASSVTDDGMRLFRERLEKAEKVLLDTKSYAAQLPEWYARMIVVQSTLNRPEDERDKVFVEGVKRYPTFYDTYFSMVEYLVPKWGGNWRSVDNMVLWSVKHTKAAEGNAMYAWLYWEVAGDTKVKLFKDTFASWPQMKLGFEDMMVRHPKSKWNLNNFAKFACMAGDSKTFLALRKQIGKGVIDAAWPKNNSLDLCESKFGYVE